MPEPDFWLDVGAIVEAAARWQHIDERTRESSALLRLTVLPETDVGSNFSCLPAGNDDYLSIAVPLQAEVPLE